jgi:hypothetical protein
MYLELREQGDAGVELVPRVGEFEPRELAAHLRIHGAVLSSLAPFWSSPHLCQPCSVGGVGRVASAFFLARGSEAAHRAQR